MQRRRDIARDLPPVAAPEPRRDPRATRCPRWAPSGPTQARFEQMLEVELAVCRAQARRGACRPDALAAIEARARVDVDRIAEIERTTDHDVIAFVSQVAESSGRRAATCTSA